VKTEVLPLYSEPRTRRRRSIRPPHVAPDRRKKKKTSGFDVAAALEQNLERYPTQEQLWQLLTRWLNVAKQEQQALS
jgi:hypothetical protein